MCCSRLRGLHAAGHASALSPPGEAWACLGEPARVRTSSGGLLGALPTTHSLGDLARALRGTLPRVTHVYFHDTDLLDRRRAALLRILLPILGRRARPTDLDSLSARLDGSPEIAWADVSRI